MQRFLKLFGSWIQFFYLCFDRVVINGYLSLLTRENNAVYFFREVCGIAKITQAVLQKRTEDYQKWVKSYAANHEIPLEWAEKGARKEEHVRPTLERVQKRDRFGVYYILSSMEQGNTFRIWEPKFPTADPNYMILRKQRSRFTHYYFYILDGVIGPMVLRVASFLPFTVTAYLNGHNFMERKLRKAGIVFTKNDNSFSAVGDGKALQEAADRFDAKTIQERIEYWTLIVGPKFSDKERKACDGLHRIWSVSQVEYSLNWIFKRNWPIRDLFERSCELGLYLLTSERIANIFGQKLTRRFNGKLMNVIQRMDQAHHVFRSHWKSSFVKQYEKGRTFLRMEVVSNNLKDFGLKKTLPHFEAVRQRLGEVVDRFADTQAVNLNVHGQFDLIGKLAKPVLMGKTKIAGVKLENTRLMRVLETLMRGVSGHFWKWTTAEIHQAILAAFDLDPSSYSLTQLRYDLRKLRAHGLIERIPNRYAYRTTAAGQKQIILLLQIRKRIYGPLAHSALVRQPDPTQIPNSKFERAYLKVDQAIDKVVELLAA